MGVQTLEHKESGETEYPSCMRVALDSGGTRKVSLPSLFVKIWQVRLDVHIPITSSCLFV